MIPLLATVARESSQALSDPEWANVILLMPLSSTIADVSSAANSVNLAGTPAIIESPAKWPGGSLNINAVGERVEIDGVSAIGTDDFTLEFWLYNSAGTQWITSVGGDRGVYLSGSGFSLWVNSNVMYCSFGAGNKNFTISLPNSQWLHIALVRISGTLYGYINGTRAGASFLMPDSLSAGVWIGEITRQGVDGFRGNVQDYRITKGVARYSGASLTVPTAPFPTS